MYSISHKHANGKFFNEEAREKAVSDNFSLTLQAIFNLIFIYNILRMKHCKLYHKMLKKCLCSWLTLQAISQDAQKMFSICNLSFTYIFSFVNLIKSNFRIVKIYIYYTRDDAENSLLVLIAFLPCAIVMQSKTIEKRPTTLLLAILTKWLTMLMLMPPPYKQVL